LACFVNSESAHAQLIGFVSGCSVWTLSDMKLQLQASLQNIGSDNNCKSFFWSKLEELCFSDATKAVIL
jgi:hypothetical protein